MLNAVLAAAPGMDWTTMSSLYPNVDTYTQQLRKLEAFTNEKPNDAAARFVLAYHYLVVGHTDAAIGELKAVVEDQPGDKVAQRMLDALQPPAADTTGCRHATGSRNSSGRSGQAGRDGSTGRGRYRPGGRVASGTRRGYV